MLTIAAYSDKLIHYYISRIWHNILKNLCLSLTIECGRMNVLYSHITEIQVMWNTAACYDTVKQ